jgi:putative methyltransferase (TIGR04325 family)
MNKQKEIFKQFVPPILVTWLRNSASKKTGNTVFTGNYVTWKDALANSVGYENQIILNKVKNATMKIVKGEAAYERDSILFDQIEYSWPLLSGLLYAASANNNRLSVLDFGGSLGTTYFQNKEFLSHLASMEWSVVEQEHFVKCGKENFENERLKYYFSIQDCVKERNCNLAILSGVLQYLEEPEETIRELILSGVNHIIIDRTLVHDFPENKITIQHVPDNIYHGSYPARFFNKEKLLTPFLSKFRLLAEFDCYAGYQLNMESIKAGYKGFLLERKKTI